MRNNLSQNSPYDILIIGGGWVGNSLACMLAASGSRIGVVEAKNVTETTAKSDYRSIVLTYSSYQILQVLGVWEKITQAYPIQHIHISHSGHFGTARFSAEEQNLPTWGHIVPAALLTQAIQQTALTYKNIEYISPAEVTKVEYADNFMQVTLSTPNGLQNLSTSLIVAADGSYSKVRQLMNINAEIFDYQQTAIVTQVELSKDHQHTAYERLTATGPLAILPRGEYQAGVIWTVAHRDVEKIMQLDDAEFLIQLQKNFGYRLGKFLKVGRRENYPLRLIRGQQQISPRIVWVGNAARTLHPIAGQGFNLGLRDAAALAQTLIEADQEDYGDIALLKRYQHWRAQDQKNIIHFTDRTVRLFAQEFFPIKLGRSLGLLSINCFPFLKRRLTQRLMGMTGKVPKLVCGVRDF